MPECSRRRIGIQLVFFPVAPDRGGSLIAHDTPIGQLTGTAVVDSTLAGWDAASDRRRVTSLNYYLMSGA